LTSYLVGPKEGLRPPESAESAFCHTLTDVTNPKRIAANKAKKLIPWYKIPTKNPENDVETSKSGYNGQKCQPKSYPLIRQFGKKTISNIMQPSLGCVFITSDIMMFLMLSLAENAIFVQIYTFYPTFGRKSTYFCPNLYFLPHIWTKIVFFIW